MCCFSKRSIKFRLVKTSGYAGCKIFMRNPGRATQRQLDIWVSNSTEKGNGGGVYLGVHQQLFSVN